LPNSVRPCNLQPAAKLSEVGTEELLSNIRLGAPASESPLVQVRP